MPTTTETALRSGMPHVTATTSNGTVLAECADRLDEFKVERLEYVLLALHALHAAAG